MLIRPECYSCLEKLIDLSVELATADRNLQAEARRQAREILAAEFSPSAIPAYIANIFHQAIKTITGNPDPFLPRKIAETELARQVAAEVVPRWGVDLTSRLALAAAGNALDFFRGSAEIANDMRSAVHFTDSQVDLLQQRLQGPSGLLLFLTDNAGEQFFDLPLVELLRFDGWEVHYVVKGGPIQNDLTRRDLFDSGLGPALEPIVDTGALTVGLVLNETSAAFQQSFAAADLILVKGMGHFETLAHYHDPRLFFLLQAKCHPVATALNVPLRSFVLRQAAT
ncbi:damage-control phosphatase ARMT1 family protein [Desulfobacca acetoxidans]